MFCDEQYLWNICDLEPLVTFACPLKQRTYNDSTQFIEWKLRTSALIMGRICCTKFTTVCWSLDIFHFTLVDAEHKDMLLWCDTVFTVLCGVLRNLYYVLIWAALVLTDVLLIVLQMSVMLSCVVTCYCVDEHLTSVNWFLWWNTLSHPQICVSWSTSEGDGYICNWCHSSEKK